tara:strand:- start:891 stop:1115 length:225 start_codon:yes stop_codon:yes gene_type:complete
MMASNYRFVNTLGDEKIKCQNIQLNKQMIEEIRDKTDILVKDMNEIKADIKLILELVKKKEERDMNKWMVWYGH